LGWFLETNADGFALLGGPITQLLQIGLASSSGLAVDYLAGKAEAATNAQRLITALFCGIANKRSSK